MSWAPEQDHDHDHEFLMQRSNKINGIIKLIVLISASCSYLEYKKLLQNILKTLELSQQTTLKK